MLRRAAAGLLLVLTVLGLEPSTCTQLAAQRCNGGDSAAAEALFGVCAVAAACARTANNVSEMGATLLRRWQQLAWMLPHALVASENSSITVMSRRCARRCKRGWSWQLNASVMVLQFARGSRSFFRQPPVQLRDCRTRALLSLLVTNDLVVQSEHSCVRSSIFNLARPALPSLPSPSARRPKRAACCTDTGCAGSCCCACAYTLPLATCSSVFARGCATATQRRAVATRAAAMHPAVNRSGECEPTCSGRPPLPRVASAAEAPAATKSRLYQLVDGSRMAAAGGIAGVVARTATAPLDRIKLLFQVQAVASSGTSADAYTGVVQAFMKINKEEGLRAFWKGNGTNVIRVAPYAAAQLSSNDFYKRQLSDENGHLSVPGRLTCGALAGMTGTALTHPLDTVRLRLALPNSGYTGMRHAFATMYRVEGVASLFKGLGPTLIGIAPYAALNFATYDMVKKQYYGSGAKQSTVSNLVLGGLAGTFAASACYPLDTVRRRMQMKGKVYDSMPDALRTIWRVEGARGFYRGWAANTLKVAPMSAIRFVCYEALKGLLGVQKKSSDT